MRKRKTFDEYLAEHLTANPYLAAMHDAIKDVPLGDVAQLDAILEAFPDEDEWRAQQQAKETNGHE